MVSCPPDEPSYIDLHRAAVEGIREALNVETHVVDDVDLGGGVTLECF
jgi:hypothetical protein